MIRGLVVGAVLGYLAARVVVGHRASGSLEPEAETGTYDPWLYHLTHPPMSISTVRELN